MLYKNNAYMEITYLFTYFGLPKLYHRNKEHTFKKVSFSFKEYSKFSLQNEKEILSMNTETK